jgi:NDP-sugar pyrophosphorylase family protein
LYCQLISLKILSTLRNKQEQFMTFQLFRCRRVSEKEYQRNTFPPYCVGMVYILSSDVLQNVTSIVETQPYFKLEDVYVGLILEKLKIVPVDRRKYWQIHYDYSWDVCKHKNLLLGLDANPKLMAQLHLKFSNLWKCGPVDYYKS